MPTHKKRHTKRHRKGTSKKVYQVGCAKRSKSQKGGSASPFDQTTFLSRTIYPLETTGGPANPIDATMQSSMQKGGSRKKRRYSRKYYKQSGGATYFDKLMPDHADQPINEKYTASNQFRV